MGTTTTTLTLGVLNIAPATAAMNAKPAASVTEACAGRDSVLEPKLDGWRLLAHVTEDGARLYTRSGNDKTSHLPHIVAELEANFPAGTWLDGEAVAITLTADGQIERWGTVQSVLGGNAKGAKAAEVISYCVFDMLAHGGIDARPLPFGKRRELLEKVFAPLATGAVWPIAQAEATEENHEAHLTLGFEGSMVKWLSAPYLSGKRGHGQFKLKAEHTEDVIITGGTEGEGSFSGLIGAVTFGKLDPATSEIKEVGKCSGMSFSDRQLISHSLPALVAKRQVIEVAYSMRMPTGGWRHPRFKRFRTDKTWKECAIDG